MATPTVSRAPPVLALLLAGCATAAPPLNLSHNDNLLGPSPAIAPARGEAASGAPPQLVAALAARWGVASDEVVLGNGSEEVLGRLVRAVTGSKRGILTHAHAYLAFRKLAEEQHLDYREAPLTSAFGIDVDALLRAVDDSTALVVLASPVNPSGSYLTAADGERLAAALETRGVLLALDSAYLEYVQAADFADPFALLKHHANVVVLATFSKVYGLTQPKVGYLVARADVADRVAAVPSPEVSADGARLALAALADPAHVAQSRAAAAASVAELLERLPALGLSPLPSQGNFVMARSPVSGTELAARLAKRGVLILDLTSYGLPDYVRITAGTPEENARLLAALRDCLPALSDRDRAPARGG